MTRSNGNKQSAEEKIAAQLIAAMEKGDMKWRKPWTADSGRQQNLTTGHKYSGGNHAITEILSSVNGWGPYWMTFGAAKKAGISLRKGEKATWIIRPVVCEKEEELEDGRKVKKGFTIFGANYVFNACQFEACEALDELLANRAEQNAGKVLQEPERCKAAEDVLNTWEVKPEFNGDRAFYSPMDDRIVLPNRKKFHSQSGLYSTWAHECVHSTGHHSRLNRNLKGTFGTEDYAREELVAELGSVIVCNRLQIGYEIEDHGSYLQSWIKVLKEEPKFIKTALSAASRAANALAPQD